MLFKAQIYVFFYYKNNDFYEKIKTKGQEKFYLPVFCLCGNKKTVQMLTHLNSN